MMTVGTWVVYVVLELTGLADPQLAKVATFWLVAVGLVAAARAMARAYCRRQVAYLQNTVIIGAGDVGQTIAKKFLNHPEYGINLVGFVDADPKERREDLDDLTILGDTSDLRDDRPDARRRPCGDRVLERVAHRDAGPDPVAEGPRRPDRRRAPPVRRRRARRRLPHRRGPAAARDLVSQALAVVAGCSSGRWMSSPRQSGYSSWRRSLR